MGDARDTGDGTHADMTGCSTVHSLASALASSASAAPGSRPNGQLARCSGKFTGKANGDLEAESDSDDSLSEMSDDPLECPHCEKTYLTERGLKRHMEEKKGNCRKTRRPVERKDAWACPRCHCRTATKSSIEHHIKNVCWKTCDECCETRMPDCDCHVPERDCFTCIKAGQLCTRRTEPVKDCVPVLLTDKQIKAEDELLASVQNQEKRKAVNTPDNSPKSKPRVKRNKESKKDDQAASKLNELGNKKARARSGTKKTSTQTATPDASPLASRKRPQLRGNGGPAARLPRPSTLPTNPVTRQQSPPLNLRPVNDIMQVQHESMRRMLAMAESRSSYGMNQRSPYLAPETRSAFDSNWTGRHDQQQHGGGMPSGFTRSFEVLQNHASYRFDNGSSHRPGSLDATGSLVSSGQPSMPVSQGLPPGSLASSRQPSLQPFTGRPHSLVNSHASGQNGTLGNDIERPELIVRLPLPPNLMPRDGVEDPANPTIRLRIHSGIWDAHKTPIFSILTMRQHDPFGPRLEYYCAERGKRFGADWKFVFKYRAPTDKNPNAVRYADLTYDLTPAQVFDEDYPTAAMRDGDTIICARNPMPGETNELQSALGCQRIDIQNGETTVWQDPDINRKWYQDLEASQAATKKQIAFIHSVNKSLKHKDVLNQGQMTTLQNENAELKLEILKLHQIIADQRRSAQGAGQDQHALLGPLPSEGPALYHDGPTQPGRGRSSGEETLSPEPRTPAAPALHQNGLSQQHRIHGAGQRQNTPSPAPRAPAAPALNLNGRSQRRRIQSAGQNAMSSWPSAPTASYFPIGRRVRNAAGHVARDEDGDENF